MKDNTTEIKELLYLEIPTPDKEAVRTWLHQKFEPSTGQKILTPEGIRLRLTKPSEIKNSANPDTQKLTPAPIENELSIFVWSLQRTTYIKVFRCGSKPLFAEKQILGQLTTDLRNRFPYQYPKPPEIDLSKQSIFDALQSSYPRTVQFFKKFPNGEYDLTRAYWWEKRWRSSVRNPTQPTPVIFSSPEENHSPQTKPTYDLIYIGGALGVIHAAVMAQLGYRVLLIERLPFGRMNREWNISRSELQSLIDLGLFNSQKELETLIACEYKDGFHKFFDANNPPNAKAAILHTPTVLNIAIDADKLLRVCGEKFKAAGGEIWDETEFISVNIDPNKVTLDLKHLPTNSSRQATGRLLVDAMGTASPIAWQLNGGRAFDSVCPTVGAVISGGFDAEVWDKQYGDVLNSHGDISRGRQLIWELFPAADNDLTIYLFHYHQVNPENPGSLLEMYEDFFTILPEYRRCDMEKLVWKKATFGYIPGHFSANKNERKVAFDRLICIGDAASLQSPLVFTGFGSLVRNLPRLTHLLNTALKHDLLKAKDLNKIRAYQSNVAVTWLFSKGMMVPTGRFIEPQKINAILNTFFGILAETDQGTAEKFIKDRVDWITFNRLALQAAWKNPALLLWILEFVSLADMIQWLRSYLNFTLYSLNSFLWGWVPTLTLKLQPWLETNYPALWYKLLANSYDLTDGVGKPQQSS
ncbi:MAG TPA: flavin-dependent dehydrogenase [Halomicronema sp.]